MKTSVVIIFLISLKSTLQYSSKCTSNNECRCIPLTDGLLADCSNLGLLRSPKFMENVISVNLSFNVLTSLPSNGILPAGLKYLDLSSNKISNFSQDGLPPFVSLRDLISLNLSNNEFPLDSYTYFPGVFKNLFDLQILDISNNSNENRSYFCPDEVFIDLRSLTNLNIDGVKNVSFGSKFSVLHNLTSLKVTGLAARGTIQKDMFQHLPFIRFLDLSSRTEWRNIEDFAVLVIEQGAFKNLSHLEVLDISYNRRLGLCGFRNVSYDLPFTSIQIFKAQYLTCERDGSSWLLTSDIKPLNETKLLELYIDGNNLDKAELTAKFYLPSSLRILSVTDNRWVVDEYAYYHTLLNLNSLTTFDASFQNKHQMSHSHNSIRCNHWQSLKPMECLCYRLQDKTIIDSQVKSITLKQEITTKNSKPITSCNNIFSDYTIAAIPPNVKTVVLENARIGYSIVPIFFANKSIRKLILRNNQLYSFNGPMCNLTNLEYLDLSGNRASEITPYVFGALPKLKVLLLDSNALGNSYIFQKYDSISILENQTNLVSLNMSSNRLSVLFRDFFRISTSLKYVYLDHNLFVDWNVSVEHINDLELIDLSWNEILYLSQSGMGLLEKSFSTNITINLLNNPFQCSCDSAEFCQWITTYKSHFMSFDKYRCSYKGRYYPITDVNNILKKDCSSYVGLIVLSVVLIVTFIVVICSLLIYRFRWKIRYWYYVMKGAYGYHRLETEDHYQFDAFVSYADSDRHFPKDEMVDYLEKQRNFRLCIHHRDFIAGCGIAENITNAIHNSRKVVCVLSEDFLKSEWCLYEFNIALIERTVARQGQNMIIMLRLGRLHAKKIPSEIMYILKEDTYIEYPENEDDRGIFWDDFADALNS